MDIDNMPPREDCLRLAWEELSATGDRHTALQYAHRAKLFLDRRWRKSTRKKNDWRKSREHKLGQAYHIVAMVYIWNNLFVEAFAIDQRFMSEQHFTMFYTGISQYLEMLIAKGQQQRLEYLFSNLQFRKYFLHHYECYVSVFIDNTYLFASMKHQLKLINKTNSIKLAYSI